MPWQLEIRPGERKEMIKITNSLEISSCVSFLESQYLQVKPPPLGSVETRKGLHTLVILERLNPFQVTGESRGCRVMAELQTFQYLWLQDKLQTGFSSTGPSSQLFPLVGLGASFKESSLIEPRPSVIASSYSFQEIHGGQNGNKLLRAVHTAAFKRILRELQQVSRLQIKAQQAKSKVLLPLPASLKFMPYEITEDNDQSLFCFCI